MAQQEYGRVVEGKIAEYPVYDVHIKNRAHPKDWYTPVLHLAKPVFDSRFEQLTQTLQITGEFIVASYTVKALSVNAILDKIFYPNGRVNLTNPIEPVVPATIVIGDIDSVLLAKTIDQVSEEIKQSLDTFVQTRNYDNVRSCVSYLNSTNTTFATEAARALSLRDQTYTALYTYLAQVQAGTQPVPKSLAEIKAILPALTWV